MTSLTDKMEGLRANYADHICRFNDAPQTCECYGLAVDDCIELAKAEAAVVGDWEADHKDFYWEQGAYEGRELGFESHVAFIKKLLADKDRDIAEAYAQGWNEGQIDLSARLKI